VEGVGWGTPKLAKTFIIISVSLLANKNINPFHLPLSSITLYFQGKLLRLGSYSPMLTGRFMSGKTEKGKI
jgi:hypothetical protein